METARIAIRCLLAAVALIWITHHVFQFAYDKVLYNQLSRGGSWRVFLGRSPRNRGFQRRLNFLIDHPIFWPDTLLAADELADQMRNALPGQSRRKLRDGLEEFEATWSDKPGTAHVLRVFGLLTPVAASPEATLLQHVDFRAPARDIAQPLKWRLTDKGLVAILYLLR